MFSTESHFVVPSVSFRSESVNESPTDQVSSSRNNKEITVAKMVVCCTEEVLGVN